MTLTAETLGLAAPYIGLEPPWGAQMKRGQLVLRTDECPRSVLQRLTGAPAADSDALRRALHDALPLLAPLQTLVADYVPVSGESAALHVLLRLEGARVVPGASLEQLCALDRPLLLRCEPPGAHERETDTILRLLRSVLERSVACPALGEPFLPPQPRPHLFLAVKGPDGGDCLPIRIGTGVSRVWPVPVPVSGCWADVRVECHAIRNLTYKQMSLLVLFESTRLQLAPLANED